MNVLSLTAAGLLSALLLLGSDASLAQAPRAGTSHAEHAAHGAAGAVAQLQLDGQSKWATDASLRTGMAAIRAAFEADHAAIHAGTETDAAYAALAAKIEAQVNDIVAHCKLPPAADANLHFVIADLLQGVSLMRGSDPAQSRHAGAALVHGALLAYGTFFDDPAWTPATR